MQRHESSFVLDATPEEIWSLWWPPAPELAPGEVQVTEHEGVRIEILHQGDEHHNGLYRHCHYPVPKYLLSGGVAESWEVVTDVVPNRSSHYFAVTKPPFAIVEGWQTLEDLGNGQTRMTFVETYHVTSRLLRFLEKPVHRFISHNNDKLFREGLALGIQVLRQASSPQP
jgi:hypothetical protein